MRGLVYKEIFLFMKSFEKIMIILSIAVAIFLVVRMGANAGFAMTLLSSMVLGVYSEINTSIDEKTNWKYYQMAFPH